MEWRPFFLLVIVPAVPAAARACRLLLITIVPTRMLLMMETMSNLVSSSRSLLALLCVLVLCLWMGYDEGNGRLSSPRRNPTHGLLEGLECPRPRKQEAPHAQIKFAIPLFFRCASSLRHYFQHPCILVDPSPLMRAHASQPASHCSCCALSRSAMVFSLYMSGPDAVQGSAGCCLLPLPGAGRLAPGGATERTS